MTTGLFCPKEGQWNKASTDNQDDYKWKNESKAQLGYGEITKGALQDLFMILQNVDKMFRLEDQHLLNGKAKDYCLTKNSTFIDIGSGFGKPVFHAAMQIGCMSKGVEIVPARLEFWVDFIYEYDTINKDRIRKFKRIVEELENKKTRNSSTPKSSKRQHKTKSDISCNPLVTDEDVPTADEETKYFLSKQNGFWLNLVCFNI